MILKIFKWLVPDFYFSKGFYLRKICLDYILLSVSMNVKSMQNEWICLSKNNFFHRKKS